MVKYYVSLLNSGDINLSTQKIKTKEFKKKKVSIFTSLKKRLSDLGNFNFFKLSDLAN